MNSKRLIIYSFLLLFFCSCKGKTPANQPEEALNPTRNAQNIQATEVVTTLIQTAPFYYRVEATGKMESLNDYTVAASTGGMLEKLYVKTGGYVSAGAVMAQFSQTLVQLKIERAKLQVFNAEKEFESQMLGYEKLLQGLSEKEKADIREKMRISSGLAPALQDLKEAEYESSQAIIKAPFGGIVANVAVRQGEMVKPGTEMFRLYNPSQMVLSAKVLESDIVLMQKNITATVYAVGSQSTFIANLYDINPVVEPNGLVTVRLLVRNVKSGTLFAGMNARAEITLPATAALSVPREALVYRGGRGVVFTYVDGLAKWNYVKTGRDNGREVEITEGLKSDDEVIVSNNVQLAHDAPVSKQDNKGTAKSEPAGGGNP